jgi:L-fucose isomerase, first N-terminal domain
MVLMLPEGAVASFWVVSVNRLLGRGITSRVGVLSFSDGRDFVHQRLVSFIAASKSVSPPPDGSAPRWYAGPSPSPLMRSPGGRPAAWPAGRPDLTIFDYPVWAFPHFSVHAARATAEPPVLFSTINPAYPGMVGLLAGQGSLDQVGRHHEGLWGDVEEGAASRASLELTGHLTTGERAAECGFLDIDLERLDA